jgi:hypothetical protein
MIAVSTLEPPRNPQPRKGEERDAEHDRHENGANPVDEMLDRRLAGLRALDQADDAIERRFGPDRRWFR